MSGIEIDVISHYVEKESEPTASRYLFAYTITIRNVGDSPGQLLNRHWIITDGDGTEQEVEGPGVVGKQPRLEPGEQFRYSSGAMLESPVGTMCGSYEFQRDDGSRFEVPIPMFALTVPNMVH